MRLSDDMTEGSHWLGQRQCRHDAGSKIDFKNRRVALYDQSNSKCLQSIGHSCMAYRL